MKAVEVEHISKSYGKVMALQDISFEVNRGELFGIIGIIFLIPLTAVIIELVKEDTANAYFRPIILANFDSSSL